MKLNMKKRKNCLKYLMTSAKTKKTLRNIGKEID